MLNFKKPVYVGDEVTASVQVKDIQRERRLITLSTICSVTRRRRQDGTTESGSGSGRGSGGDGEEIKEDVVVIDGEAVIYYPHLE